MKPKTPSLFGDGEGKGEAWTLVYINRQHSLYQREAQKPDTYLLNVTRLITQEISLIDNRPRLLAS